MKCARQYRTKIYLLVSAHVLAFLVCSFVFLAYAQGTDGGGTDGAPAGQQQSCCGGTTDEQGEDVGTPHTVAGSYYSLRDGLAATLLLNNKGPREMTAAPALFSAAGARLDVGPVVIGPRSFRLIDLREWAAPGGPDFEEGSLQVVYRGRDLELGAQLYLTDPGRSLSFEEKLVELKTYTAARLEAVWWEPSRQTEVRLVLSNTTGEAVSGAARVFDAKPGHEGAETVFDLGPHETRVIDVSRSGAGDREGAGGGYARAASIEHAGPGGAVIARALTQDASAGYSSTVQFSDPAKGRSSRYEGAGLRLKGASGEPLTPVVVARNLGEAATTLGGRVPYTEADGTAGAVSLRPTRLASGETKVIDLQSLVARAGSSLDVATAGLEFEYAGAPGSVVMAAYSVSADSNHVFRVPLWDPLAQRSPTGGYPWYIEGSSSTTVHIKNITDREQHYVAYLSHEEGTYEFGVKSVKPHQTVTLDLRALRDEQAPDEDEKTIPLTASRGQFHWSLLRTEEAGDEDGYSGLALIGRSEQADWAAGVSSNYACQNCCADSYSETWVEPAAVSANVGSVMDFIAYQRNSDCYGGFYPRFRVTGASWSTSNSSVATVVKVDGNGRVTTQGAGSVQIKASWNVYVNFQQPECGPGPYSPQGGPPDGGPQPLLPACGTCSSFPSSRTSSADLQVSPQVDRIQYRRNGVWTDVPAGGFPSVCPGSSITFRALATGGAAWPSGRPVWGGAASGTGAEKTVTFNSAGATTVSAFSGNVVSVPVNVGAANGTVAVSWSGVIYTSSPSTAPSSTVERTFNVTYAACSDVNNNVWRLRVASVTGGVDITLTTGGSRNPDTQPPVNQAEAADAVTDMKGYYARGSRGNWHTVGASRAHEDYHYTEWQCSGNHYWPATENAIEVLTVPYHAHASPADAVNALRTMANGADAKVGAFQGIARQYWFTLSDGPSSRPLAAGQLVLNGAVIGVQNLAAANGWVVPQGVDTPSTANPCYQPWLPYAP